ncbi:hypothetical protein F5J12DRAFT_890134 [Pisolithus orientalis]|uniref:uncharacterized protein n=1 Tax=Pisolithus orientalis TaxID=936130 RepID=UPI002223FAA0|nr:uncharacterized protein F5J12DRAFT_890134 [Pisolithus orientalis]KAI6019836.1 hypothetical protein F5J12DRAFT_890134 [Pisolithus orientalis]
MSEQAFDSYPGLCHAVSPSEASPLELLDVSYDMTSEQQTLPGPVCGSVDTNNEFSAFQAMLLDASKGVTEGMDAEYKCLMQQCQRFLVGMGWLRGDESFYSNQPHHDAPTFIIAWIMNAYPPSSPVYYHCLKTDENDVDSGRYDSITLKGTSKPPSEEQGTYGHAQKMRAAMTYAFGRLHGLGDMPWHQSEVPGNSTMLGNPSMSVQVSSYMCALWHCKVQAGEVTISARAITSEILSQLYHFNHLPDNWTIHPYQPGTRRPCDPNHHGQDDRLADWGGARAHRLLQAAYTIAFICLL